MKQSVESFSRKNLIAFGAVALIALVLASLSFIHDFSDISNLLFAPFKPDMKRLISENTPVHLDFSPTNDDDMLTFEEFGEMLENGELPADFDMDEFRNSSASKPGNERHYNPQTTQFFLYNEKYAQDGKYVFKITPDIIYESGLEYGTRVYMQNTVVADDMTSKYLICWASDIVFFAKVPYSYEPTSSQSLTGVFVPYAQHTIEDFALCFQAYGYVDNLLPLEFDTSISFKSEQLSALAFSLLLLAPAIFLLIKFLMQLINKEKRPVYRDIKLLGGDASLIDKELESCELKGKIFITANWTIKPDAFRTRVSRHRKDE